MSNEDEKTHGDIEFDLDAIEEVKPPPPPPPPSSRRPRRRRGDYKDLTLWVRVIFLIGIVVLLGILLWIVVSFVGKRFSSINKIYKNAQGNAVIPNRENLTITGDMQISC
jgi:hypothetical protein